VGTVFGSTAAADTIESVEIELTSGQTDRPIGICCGGFALLTLFGDQFSMNAGLQIPGGIVRPSAELIPGTTVTVHAIWSGVDLRGSFTYQGQTVMFNGITRPSGIVDFLSVPFVVPPFDGSPVANVPFTLTGGITASATTPRLALHGTGNMTFTFLDPRPDLPPPLARRANGEAQWFVTTPEPSAILLALTALGGLGVCAWRRRRSRPLTPWTRAGRREGAGRSGPCIQDCTLAA
jgi:hypothetical protein